MRKSFTSQQQNQVERAVAELRRGMPVILVSGTKKIQLESAEEFLPKTKRTNATLVVTAHRAQFLLGNKKITQAQSLPLGKEVLAKLGDVTGKTLKQPDAKWVKHYLKSVKEAGTESHAAFTLMRIAELMPAVIFSDATQGAHDLLSVNAKSIEAYEEAVAYGLKVVSEAPLTLADAADAKIIAFRPYFGGKEHYAIVIGKPNLKKAPTVRIHSSCYTGDLLGSLKCDCGDQLRAAIRFMNKNDGGVILYLMQEGRGIGLVNKLRAYTLQAKELDTVDANEFLGFDDDERPFLPAAVMLKALGVKAIRLMTNNPRKVKGIEKYGIKVTERVNHEMEHHEHNHAYLETKFSRLGHVRK
ncbi:MAG: GTP cyclohydrolase II [Proteobacteria bacterium]|nr:GTP cyclohydrolase II [Pseudomonadota bacterium]